MAANRNRFTRAAAGDLTMPLGFRFRPTEEELIDYYLQMKLEGKDYLVSDVIREINICSHEPWDLPGFSLIKSDDQEWYFFSTYKKNNRNQTERATKNGFWKITGAQKPVKTQDNRTIIGKKRILTFYRGTVRNSQRTNWGMHEYYIPQTNPNANQRDFVLCCVKKKLGENVDAANCDEGEYITYNNESDFENQLLRALGMDIEEEHTQQQQSMDYFEREEGRMLASAPGNNDYHGLQYAFGADEPDDKFAEFLNSIIVDRDQDETTHANIFNDSTHPDTTHANIFNVSTHPDTTHANIFNDSTLPESITRVYFEDEALSSDADTEILLAQEMSLQMLSEPPVDSSHSRRQEGVMLCQAQAASSVNVVPKPQTDHLQVVTDEHSGIHRRQLVNDEHSGTHQRTSRPQRESRHNNALNVKNASSVDVDAELPQIKCIRLAPDEYYNNERTRRRTNPTSALEALSKQKELKQQQSKAKEAAELRAAVDFPPKLTSISKSNKEAEVAQGNNAEKGVKQTQNTTITCNWKGCSFISWETSPPLTSPPSEYLFNMFLGIIMFCFFAWQVILYG
ncbi:protein NTM1-like 9 isoform X3 [Pyrus x bretschneideri]|uniref:protein NTM1-like 9 isoform X2 n=1 Tax=Pyrus x bretschneideri TaxID=225117 RepID=UPI00202EA112|nr:protein NTM1-like 9 isoform X2 [Pyrus x bretschneideri]XP_048422214.1 protein NTM1-like 9 isoform X3 [Pyrus x bretschneideri]